MQVGDIDSKRMMTHTLRHSDALEMVECMLFSQ